MAKVNAHSFRGYRTLRNENPRMGVRGRLEGVEMGMIGLLLPKEEVLLPLVHRHTVSPCKAGHRFVVVEADQELPDLRSMDHPIPLVLPMHSAASQYRGLDLL